MSFWRLQILNGGLIQSPLIGFWTVGDTPNPSIPNLALENPPSDAAAAGGTVSVTASVIAGVASGAAATGGQTVTATETIIAGGASGTAAAAGGTVSVIASVIAGVATGETVTAPATGGNSPWRRRPGLRPTRDGAAAGALLVVRVSILPGTAWGELGFDPVEIDNDFLLMAA